MTDTATQDTKQDAEPMEPVVLVVLGAVVTMDDAIGIKLAVEERALLATLAARKERAKQEKISPLFVSLAPVRAAYRKGTTGQRAQLLALVVSYITEAT